MKRSTRNRRPSVLAQPAARALVVTLATTLAFVGCAPSHPSAPHPPTVDPGTPGVLMSVDTRRADRQPPYGYPEGATPALDSLATDSVLFERAFSHTPLTLPSHCTVLTGRLPMGHGVHDNVGYSLDSRAGDYLPLLLQSAGYRTAAAVSALALPASSGLGAGFDFYEDDFEWKAGTGLGEVQRRGEETLARLRPWLALEDARPPFVFLHLYEPHSPYDAPKTPANATMSPYDAEVAAADRIVGDFLMELRDRSLYDRSLIVLFSDHGEGLGDHGELEHGLLLYPETLHVPLLIKLPFGQGAGTRRPEAVGLVDIAPTLLGLLDLEPHALADGRDLFDPALESRPQVAETLYPRLHFGWSELVSVVDDHAFYVHGPDPEFYDLASDPRAEDDRIDTRRREAHALRRIALDYGLVPEAPSPPDESSRALAALGYVTTTSVATSHDQLPDPKTRIHTLENLTEGFKRYREEDFRGAVEAFSEAVVDNPGLIHAWEYLARSKHNLGLLDDALLSYRRAIDLVGASSSASSSNAAPAAMILMELGRLDEAIALLRSQLRLDPGQRRLQDLEVRALLSADRIAEGVDRARTVQRQYPDDPDTSYQLGVALLLAGDLEGAATAFDRTLTVQPNHAAAAADRRQLAIRRGVPPD